MRALFLILALLTPTGSASGEPQTPTSPEADAIRELVRQGEYARAESDARALLSGLENTQGSDPVVIARVIDVLVEALMRAGKATDPETVALAKRALDMNVELHGNDDPWTMNSAANVATLMFYAGDYAAARTYYEQVVGSQTRVLGPDHLDTARNTNNLALVLWRLGEYDEATALYERVLPVIARELGADHPDVAAVLNNLGLILWRMSDYAAARSYFERALGIREAALGEAHPDVALTLSNLGMIVKESGDFAAARPYLERAVLSYEQTLGLDHADLARPLHNLGNLEHWLGEYDRARDFYERALRIRVQALGTEHPDVADTRAELGRLEADTGHYEAARVHHENALRIRETVLGAEHPDVAFSLHDLGVLLRALGDLERAAALDERALAIREKAFGNEHPAVANSLNHLATYSLGSNPARAVELYRRSFEIRERALGPEHPFTVQSLGNLGLALGQAGSDDEARSILESVLEIQERVLGPEHPAVADTLIELAQMSAPSAQTLALCDRARAILAASLGGDHPFVAHVLGIRSQILFRSGNHEAARVEAELAAVLLGAHRREAIRSLPERQALAFASYFADRSEIVLFSGLVTRGGAAWITAAWEWALRDRGVVLDEVAARQRSALSRESREAVEAWGRLVEARQHLAAVWVRGPESDDPEGFKTRLATARERKEGAERDLAKASLGYRAMRSAPHVGLDSIGAVLPESSALVEIVRVRVWSTDTADLSSHDVALILSAEADSTASFVDLGPSAEIDRLVGAWRSALQESAGSLTGGSGDGVEMSSHREAGARLREVVWDPIEERTGPATTVFLVPDGSLHHVDYRALPTARGRFVAESGIAIQLLGSGRDLLEIARARPRVPARGALVVGNPDFGAAGSSSPATTRAGTTDSACAGMLNSEWLPLPESEHEAREIAELFAEREGAVVLSGPAADEAALMREVRGKRVVHLATHGFFLDHSCEPAGGAARRVGGTEGAETSGNPLLLSGLVLAGANGARGAAEGNDGILTAEEVAALNLDGVELVVLSACETGLGGIVNGQGVLGLRRAAEISGARSVVMSLWTVPDRWARRWMIAMYTEWLAGASVVDAAQTASLASLSRLREQGRAPHPYLWAGFVTAGDWR